MDLGAGEGYMSLSMSLTTSGFWLGGSRKKMLNSPNANIVSISVKLFPYVPVISYTQPI